jgi:hypothetical protein
MRKLKAVMLLGLCCGCGPIAAAAMQDAPARIWRFTVLLDGTRIGEHAFIVAQHGDEVVVDTLAHFKVKALFIPLYSYDHQDHEIWRHGCVAAINSETHDNGKTLAVQGSLHGDVLDVRSARGAESIAGCVKTFAYWDKAFLAERRLLNSQTGEYQPIAVTRTGLQDITSGGRPVSAARYEIRAPRLSIDLWYSSAGDWLALESKLDNGRTLRYETQ